MTNKKWCLVIYVESLNSKYFIKINCEDDIPPVDYNFCPEALKTFAMYL